MRALLQKWTLVGLSSLLAGCFQPVREASASAQPPDAAAEEDAGRVLIRCTSGPVSVDGGIEAFHVWITELPDYALDGGGVFDGGFRLRAWAGALHPASGGVPAEVLGEGVVGVYPYDFRLGSLSITFGDGGSLWAGESYLPDFSIGTVTLGDVGGPIWCWAPGQLHRAHYDSTSGQCVDDRGHPGSPTFTMMSYVRETGDGECAHLGGDLAEGDTSNPALLNWNLRGADLTQASLHSASLGSAQLEGANLSTLNYGNAQLAGAVDAFSRLPPSCGVSNGQAECRQ